MCYLDVEGPSVTPLLHSLFEFTDSLLSQVSQAFFKLSIYSCCDRAKTCARMPSSHSFRPAEKKKNYLNHSFQCNIMTTYHLLLSSLHEP